MAKAISSFSEEEWMDMAFKYDLTEFCTCIKPTCFRHLMELGYEKVLYFDPDIYIFSPIDEILYQLNHYDMVLTPQIAGIHPIYSGEHPEWAMNVNGIFNLGFCGMRNSPVSCTIIDWWQKRLVDNCFADRSTGNFTDQKWMDWMPGFLGSESLYVFHNLGMNMAPWNFFERELYLGGEDIMVKYRTDDNPQRNDRLVFLHFAGYDYQQLKQGIISRKRITDLKDYKDLELATNIYRDAIVDQRTLFDEYILQEYSYGKYDNGTPIAAFHRRLYHGAIEYHHTNPFSTQKGSFYDAISKKGMIINERLDNLSRKNIQGLDKKKKMIARLFRFLFFLMGYKRYVLFVKSLYFYCRPELHTFLIKHPKQ